jgi:hypothetical protein
MDAEIDAAKTKLNTAPDAAAKDREAAVREYDVAKVDLKTSLTNLNNATADTWADAKAKVAVAWQRVKAAYDKATS